MIHIFFRTTSNKRDNKDRPDWFSYERCWKNLLGTCMDNPITVIHDGEIEFEWFKEMPPANVDIMQIDSEKAIEPLIKEWEDKGETYVDQDAFGNSIEKRLEKPDREKAAGSLMYEIIFNKIKDVENKNELVYMIEDDYIHLEGWPAIFEDVFYHYKDLTYATLYDHPDKYTERYKGLQTPLIMSSYSHWRFVPSSCGTFGGRISAFLNDKEIHMNDLGDHNKFLKLAQRNRSIISPVPGFATHCINNFLAPYRDWSRIQ